MTTVIWQTVAVAACGRAEPAELLEERVYPTDPLELASGAFQVRARKCDHAEECREAGLPCRWTGLNPNFDPFAD
jgi:hypothetical protein